MLLVLLLLVVGLVVGLVAAAARLFAPDPAARAQSCVATVAPPEADEEELRAELAPDQAVYAALVVGVANQRGLPARAATIGIATAIQESGLRNIDYGDRDSLGLFQQRPSQGWGSEEQVQDPLYSTNTFYDALVEVDGYTELDVTVAAQEVQRSGFPDAYADHEGEGRALASALYGLSPATLTCDLRPVEDDPDRATPDEQAAELLANLGDFGPLGWEAGDVAPVGTGDDAAGPTASGTGRAAVVVDLSVAGAADPDRVAWALAHASVAMASARDVVLVEVDGQVWDRTRPGDGWTSVADGTTNGSETGSEAGSDERPAPAAGTVRVTVG
ncbi:hypothetical protein [Aquipuribacter sp. MA13-13]|uniref:hypothetical protein n=1 Tax=Aquipuribacter sp. MA13-13 TaxID=3440840 RepID=UPI003EF0233F